MNENLPNNPQIQVLKSGTSGLFTNYIYKAIPLAFDESMSYYETLCGLLNYLKNVVIPTVNNNADAVAELQSLYEQLRTYVDNYFTNLDVQEEINNKLDDMVEDGTIPEIIASYLNSKAIFGFDNVASMKQSTNLINGSYAETLGYYNKNDGGGALYKIRTITNEDVVDNMFILPMTNNTLVAELIIENKINILQLGAKFNDDTFDNLLIFNNAINFANKDLNIYIPSGSYSISNTLNINKSTNIIGENENNTVLKITSNNDFIKIMSSYTTIEKLKITTTVSAYNSSLITLSTESNAHCWRQIIKHCIIDGISKLGNGIKIYPKNNKGLMNDLIENVTLINLYNGIFMSAENLQSWANGGIIKDCWQYDCVYGLNFDNNANAFGYWNIKNFMGQHSNDSIANINNVVGQKHIIENCFMSDGGQQVVISEKSRLLTLINGGSINRDNLIIDNGYLTNIIIYGETKQDNKYYEFNDNFFGKELSNIWNSAGNINTGLSNANLASPCVALTTDATNGAEAYINFNHKNCLNEFMKNIISFKFQLPNTSNVRILMGLCIQANLNGDYIKYSTDISNKLYATKLNSNTDSATLDLIDTLSTDWHTVQIMQSSQTSFKFWIDDNYIGELTGNRYSREPLFYIKTLDDTAKTLYISNLKIRSGASYWS